jgi:hypothetical protein
MLSRWQAWLLTILVVAALEPASWMTSQIPLCIVNPANYGGDYAQNDECPPFHIFLIVTVARVLEAMGHEWLTAISTVVIAGFTATLWWSTRGMLRSTNESIGLARDEFLSTHRPQLIVRQFQLNQPLPDHIVTISFSIINAGDTEATLRLIAAEVALWNGRYWEAPGIDFITRPVNPKVIRNGQRISITIVSRFKITDAQIKAVEQKTLSICAVGEFTYTDPLGTERRTGFRRNYDVSTDMFIASENKDQEYQD